VGGECVSIGGLEGTVMTLFCGAVSKTKVSFVASTRLNTAVWWCYAYVIMPELWLIIRNITNLFNNTSSTSTSVKWKHLTLGTRPFDENNVMGQPRFRCIEHIVVYWCSMF
jgi:hypothetical protein